MKPKVKLGISEYRTGRSLLRQAHVAAAGVPVMFKLAGDDGAAQRLTEIERRLQAEIEGLERRIEKDKQH